MGKIIINKQQFAEFNWAVSKITVKLPLSQQSYLTNKNSAIECTFNWDK